MPRVGASTVSVQIADEDGLNYRIGAFAAGRSTTDLAHAFRNAAEFEAGVGAPVEALTDRELVRALNKNVLDRQVEREGMAFRTEALGNPDFLPSRLVLAFPEGEEDALNNPRTGSLSIYDGRSGFGENLLPYAAPDEIAVLAGNRIAINALKSDAEGYCDALTRLPPSYGGSGAVVGAGDRLSFETGNAFDALEPGAQEPTRFGYTVRKRRWARSPDCRCDCDWNGDRAVHGLNVLYVVVALFSMSGTHRLPRLARASRSATGVRGRNAQDTTSRVRVPCRSGND